MSARNSRFIERVQCERTALGLVNNTFTGAEPLCALSDAAIGKWKSRAATMAPPSTVEIVVQVLRELSVRLDIQADNSREIFESVETVSDTNLLVDRLKAACSEARC